MPHAPSCRTFGLLLLTATLACAPESAAPAPRVMTTIPHAGTGGSPTYAAGSGGLPKLDAANGGGGIGGVYSPVLPTPVLPMAGMPAAGSGPNTAGKDAKADCGAIRQKAEGKPGPVDIVWVIDGSGSMGDEQLAVQQNLATFATAIGSAGIDHHVIMVADDDVAAGTALGKDPAHYKHVPANVGSHNALSVLLESYAQYSTFLRPTASLHFVMVTDDESNMKASDFRTQMEQKAGKKFTAHSIVSESVNGRACVGACGISLLCGAASPGLEYIALSDATAGQKISICVSDWSMVFGPLKMAVITSAPLPCEYALPAPPSGASLDPTLVNVGVLQGAASPKTLPRASSMQACANAEAWFYDDPKSPTMIRMCPAACSSITSGGSIEITLGCETISLN